MIEFKNRYAAKRGYLPKIIFQFHQNMYVHNHDKFSHTENISPCSEFQYLFSSEDFQPIVC